MAHYLLECTYTTEALAALIKQPQNRIETGVKPIVEKAGGRVVNGWFTPSSDRHLVCIADLPNTVTTAALSYAVGATHTLTNLRITPLITGDEFVEALRKAPTLGYRPPIG